MLGTGAGVAGGMYHWRAGMLPFYSITALLRCRVLLVDKLHRQILSSILGGDTLFGPPCCLRRLNGWLGVFVSSLPLTISNRHFVALGGNSLGFTPQGVPSTPGVSGPPIEFSPPPTP